MQTFYKQYIRKVSLIFIVLAQGLILSAPIHAKPPATVKYSVEREENTKTHETLVLPYVFSTDDLGIVAGVGAMATGIHQKQMTLAGTAYGGDSKGLGLMLLNYRVLDSQRFFFSAIGVMGDFPLLRAYSAFPGQYVTGTQPGANDSSFDDFIQASGTSNWWDISLEYVLPWGSAKQNSMATYNLQGGLLVNPKKQPDWNPLKSGTSILIARQFNRYQLYENDQGEVSGAVHGFELGYYYNNTDFPANPSQGSSQYIGYSYNPEWLEARQQWDFIELEVSKYFSLGATSFAKQNIIALNGWLGYSPSWDVIYNEQGASQYIDNAPFLEGATLGGMYRMRGFRQNRFHDKAVIYATAEYRMTLAYNPIADIHWLRFLNLDWFQTVFYVEGGRVSPTMKTSTLLSDWKADVGVSLRALTSGVVLRLDITTTAHEGSSTWLMVGHPF
ncbi:BamA/TamA family outer membrane protein [Colwellia echini]|uniref:BamA/TamA family outer membrane protein n=1 Tax=Colwellia echini TaxID=1982103 RepID=A0ABY3MY84_9GAMM|nr:BamA/TamA family outer membrane protein [Colwellia echini]TYK66186.1 BamA/TamA family outer membrane protein [Colwellia echini]